MDEATWASLSNRLLTLQELFVGVSKLAPEALLERLRRGVGWTFDKAELLAVEPADLNPPPTINRGRYLLDVQGDVYLAYFEGPPRPLYLVLAGVRLSDPQEYRLCALFFEHLLAALEASGYRQELEAQAHCDWLTGLYNGRFLRETLAQGLPADQVLGLVELEPRLFEGGATAQRDLALQAFAHVLSAALPTEARAFRLADRRFAVVTTSDCQEAVDAVVRQSDSAGHLVWATAAEAAGAALLELAEKRLLGLIGPLVEPRRPNANVAVHSRYEQIRLAYEEVVAAWDIDTPTHLIVDGPNGFALETFDDTLRPALIVTDSRSNAYLSDLWNLNPEGLLVGVEDKAQLERALKGVAAGEKVYAGPELYDEDLYPREREVWRLLAQGLDNAQIATRLGVSDKTVANYVSNLQDKLHLNSRVALVLHYMGQLPPTD